MKRTHRYAGLRASLVFGVAVIGTLLVASVAAPAASPAPARLPSWQPLTVPVVSTFHGLSAVNSRIAWLGGAEGLVLRTVDGGRSWRDVSPPGAGALEFRDIEAFSADRAVAMSGGGGPDARVYFTGNGGASWQLAYQNSVPTAFFDCMSFYDGQHGLLLADPVDGKFRILSTRDGGRSWVVLPNIGMPPAFRHEYAFSASGTCLTTLGPDAWFGSGGKDVVRVFHSADGGFTWDAAPAPFPARPAGGIFGIAFRSAHIGIAVGGIGIKPTRASHVVAITSGDGMWRAPATHPDGVRGAVAFLPGMARTAITVGLTGSDISYDDGNHWTEFSDTPFITIDCTPDGSCWAAGDQGRAARLHR